LTHNQTDAADINYSNSRLRRLTDAIQARIKSLPNILKRLMHVCKTNYQIILSIGMLLSAILIVYWRDLSILLNEAVRSEAVSHVLIVPALTAYLIYRKKDAVKASFSLERLRKKTGRVSMDEVIGLALCLSALLLYWYGSYTFSPVEYHLASLPLLVAGMLLVLFNRKTVMIMIFPVLFLLFLVPPPSTITYTAGALMANFNTRASYTLLRACGLPVTLSSTYGAPTIILSTPSGGSVSFAVDLACSGIYSLTAFTMFAVFLAYIIRGSIPRKGILFGLGFSILIALNVVRVLGIVFIGYQFGEEIAMTIFHTVTGWLLIFAGILILLFVAERLLHLEIFSNSTEISECSECRNPANPRDFCQTCGRFLGKPNPKISRRFWVKAVALLLGCFSVVLSINSPVFALAQGAAITSQNWETSRTVFPEFLGYNLSLPVRDYEFEKISGQDASLTYAYIPSAASEPTVYVLVGVADSITNLHNWEVCWVTWQTAQGNPPLVPVIDSRDIQILQNPSIIGRYFVFINPSNLAQVTLYWYERALFHTGTTIQQKYVRLSLIILTADPADYRELEEKLLPFGQSIAEYWEPLKEQSLISIAIPIQQLLLAGSIVFAVITGTAQYANEKRRKRNNLRIFESFATPKEKLVLATIQKLSRERKEATLKTIRETVNEVSDETMEADRIIDIISDLEKHGIVKKDIVNLQNNPKLVWKF